MAGRAAGGPPRVPRAPHQLGEPTSLFFSHANLEVLVTLGFEDIIVCFTPDEWQLLTWEQKQLYWETLRENYNSLVFVGGCPITTEEAFAWEENNKRLSIRISRPVEEHPPPPPPPLPPRPPPPSPFPEAPSAGEEEQSWMDVGSFPEQVGPLEIIVKEEEDTNCSEAEGCPGQSCVSATEQGSVPDAGRQTKTESAERASGPKRVEDTLRPCYVRLELLPKPVAVVAPEKSKLKSRTTAALPKCDLPTGAEQPVEEKQFARAPSVKNRTGSRWQAVVPALAQSTTQMQDTRPTPLVVPPKKRKHYFCAWCKETFRLQINLEVHYRYCRRKQLQELGTVLKTEENPDGQGTSGSSSTGGASGPALLQQNAQHPPSEDRKGDLHCGPSQRRQGAVKTKDASDAGRGAAEGRSGLTATVSAMKKLCRCPECGERFVYKWQLAAHRGCKANVPPEPPDLAARAGPSRTETQEPSFALAEHPGTSKDAPLYSCRECGKNFSRHYLSTHRAFHEGLRYRCLWCGKVFHYQSGAKRHQRVHYKKGQKDTCPKCKENGCFCMVEKIHVASRSDDREEAGQKEPK